MTTIAEIESAIEKLPAEEMRALREWIVARVDGAKGRMWTPEELGEAMEKLLAETDPARADALQARIVAGFCGSADA